MPIFTCAKDCSGRKPGCHDHCEKYQRERAEHEKAKAFLEAANDVNYRAYWCNHPARRKGK